MIEGKFVDQYARGSGVRDKLVAERDIVLTYALQWLIESGVMAHLAFKGGTCLRKMVFGSSGRFSEDLDFTLDTDSNEDDVFTEVVDAFNSVFHGITFHFDDYYLTDDGFGGEVQYRHDWNEAGHFRLQISNREKPTLSLLQSPHLEQAYFKRLEFIPLPVRSLRQMEMIAEKIRASFQRIKVRDIYDLHRFSKLPFEIAPLRSLVVLKLWQARVPFDPDGLMHKIRSSQYDWDDLRRLLRTDAQLDPESMLREVEAKFGSLRALTELEKRVIADSRSGRDVRNANELREVIRNSYAETRP